MTRGRPLKSQIRQNITEILGILKDGYGYEIAKIYLQIFPRATQRVIYYHLRKGLATKEFKIYKIEREKGDYSWGGEAEKIYYSLGEMAELKNDSKAKRWFEKHPNLLVMKGRKKESSAASENNHDPSLDENSLE